MGQREKNSKISGKPAASAAWKAKAEPHRRQAFAHRAKQQAASGTDWQVLCMDTTTLSAGGDRVLLAGNRSVEALQAEQPRARIADA